ncbi:transport and Golgi organization protein 2 [Frankliniella occidentalis]|uniref:Transport and Golgi organization protein 2 n=1 Tax=Frankliniella occidentalis TaxID=133901 RepID=A0A6J1SEQ4_FRAOC|nr:transport and Golgi organization protein 2 [Frankliniella occidentalis]XP_026279504.1 transport and Golgi organization protein 2 [Frankliniella occidentalis]XP_052123711.1 transport and Golgi organization protein 2 [Frankliniella occidentalis]
MCILFVEVNDSPAEDGYRLILASNRDEHYRRPTDYAHHWEEAPSVFGGRDMEPGREGGTWLALDTAGAGRLAALLNVMGTPSKPDSRPRGMLVADYVRGAEHAECYSNKLAAIGTEYSAFHLVTIDLNPSKGGLWHYSNCTEEEGVGGSVTHLRRGRFALGNSLVHQPFRKVTAGGQRFEGILDRCGKTTAQRDKLVAELEGLLKWNQEHYPDETLEGRAAKGNLRKETVHMHSVVFQRHPTYGTRTHTIILVDANWRCDYYEMTLGENRETTMNPDTSRWHHIHKTFQLEDPSGK